MSNFGERWWTPERNDEAYQLYIVEGKSASKTAHAIGAISRNAIIGRAHRMGWIRPDEFRKLNVGCVNAARNKKAASERKRLWRAAEPKEPPKPMVKRERRIEADLIKVGTDGRLPKMDAVIPIDSLPVSFRDRPRFRCSWPIDDVLTPGSADTICCGAPAVAERPYCSTHLQRSFSGKRLSKLKWSEPTVIEIDIQRAKAA